MPACTSPKNQKTAPAQRTKRHHHLNLNRSPLVPTLKEMKEREEGEERNSSIFPEQESINPTYLRPLPSLLSCSPPSKSIRPRTQASLQEAKKKQNTWFSIASGLHNDVVSQLLLYGKYHCGMMCLLFGFFFSLPLLLSRQFEDNQKNDWNCSIQLSSKLHNNNNK